MSDRSSAADNDFKKLHAVHMQVFKSIIVLQSKNIYIKQALEDNFQKMTAQLNKQLASSYLDEEEFQRDG